MDYVLAAIGIFALAGALLCVRHQWEAPNKWLLHPSHRDRVLIQSCVLALLYFVFFPIAFVGAGRLLERLEVQAGVAADAMLLLSPLPLAAMALFGVIRLATRKQRRLDAKSGE